MDKVVILVLTWNNADDSIECIESLLRQTYQPLTILSVDNKSTDNSADRMQAFADAHPEADIRYVRHDENRGTAGGFNVALRWARENSYDYVGTLNADAVADQNWVGSLVEELKNHPETGMATGLMLRRDGKTVDTSGDFYSMWGMPGPRGRDQPVEKVSSKAGYVFGSSGAGYLMRVKAVIEVGYFEERYFMYFEDVDYSFRMQLMGYKVRYTPQAKAFHKVGASSKTVPGLAVYNTFKNLPMLMWRNVPGGLLPRIAPRFMAFYTLIFGSALLHGRAIPAMKGLWTSFTYLPYTLNSRRHIQKQKTVSDQYVRSIILDRPPGNQLTRKKSSKTSISS